MGELTAEKALPLPFIHVWLWASSLGLNWKMRGLDENIFISPLGPGATGYKKVLPTSNILQVE